MNEFDDLVRADELKVGKDALNAGYHVDMSELARLILDWELMKKELDRIEEEIERDVLILAETQKVGNVHVTYTKGRRELDYKSPGIEQLDDDTIETYTEHMPQRVIEAYDEIDWRKACQAAGVEPVVVKEGTPSAKIKLVK